MAFFDQTHPAAHGTLRRTVGSLVAAYNDWHNAALNRKALSKLTDAELDDIGLSRADLDLTGGHDSRIG